MIMKKCVLMFLFLLLTLLIAVFIDYSNPENQMIEESVVQNHVVIYQTAE